MFFISLFPRVSGKRETLWLCTLRYTVAYAEYSRNSKVGTWRRLAKAKGYLEDELVFLLVTELVFLGWCFFLPSDKMLKCLAGRGWIQGLNQPMNFENLRRWLRKRCLLKYLTKYEPDCNWTWKRFHFYFGWWDWFESNKVHIIITRAKGECRVNQVLHELQKENEFASFQVMSVQHSDVRRTSLSLWNTRMTRCSKKLDLSGKMLITELGSTDFGLCFSMAFCWNRGMRIKAWSACFKSVHCACFFFFYWANFVVVRGHEYWQPGVYVSPKCSTARSYARPHQLFNDNIYYRCVLKAGGV